MDIQYFWIIWLLALSGWGLTLYQSYMQNKAIKYLNGVMEYQKKFLGMIFEGFEEEE